MAELSANYELATRQSSNQPVHVNGPRVHKAGALHLRAV